VDNRRWIIPTVLSLVLVVALVWGYNQFNTKNDYETALTNQYQRLFYDTKKHVENVQVSLSKALVSDSKEQNILLLSQVMNEAYFAQDKLSQMPVTHADIAKTQKFLTQVADYSYSLIQDHLDGKELTNKQRETLFNLQGNTSNFNKELSALHDKILEGDFNASRTSARERNKLQQANKEMLQTRLVSFEKQMGKSPELIYDGPFSDQRLNKKPVGLGNKKVTKDEAKRIAKQFVGDKKVDEITSFEEGKDISKVAIPSHTFNVLPKNTSKDMAIYMGVSKQGGNVVWMVNPRRVSKNNLSMKQAEQEALKFLKEKGFTNMEPNYSLKYDGVAVFNFAYKEGNVTVYPDLIKLKVALDNGEIIGFDSAAYLMNHKKRNIQKPNITPEKARESVKIDFDIDSTRLAMIPKGSKEILCYEFKGKYKGSDFIIYINALNGKEEDILQIIKSENGTLTF